MARLRIIYITVDGKSNKSEDIDEDETVDEDPQEGATCNVEG